MAARDPAGGSVEESESEREVRASVLRELHQRGVTGALAERLATELAALAPGAREGAVEGAALAAAANRRAAREPAAPDPGRSRRELDEIQRMMGAFAGELQKVDEALKLLSTYVARMRAQASEDPDRIVH